MAHGHLDSQNRAVAEAALRSARGSAFRLGATEIQPGCLSCCVYEEKGPDHAVVFGAHWETEEALHEHICSDFYRRLLVACELSNRPPEVFFHQVSATQGMDLIQQLRGRGGERLPATPEAPAR